MGPRYGTIGLVGVGLFAAALVTLHVLVPDLSVVDEYLSVYALGEYGWLMRVGPVVLGIGIIAVGLGLRATLAPGKRVTASWALIMLAGFGFIAAGLFETDPTAATEYTTAGAIHDLAGLVYSISLLIASWTLRGVFARDDGYRHLARAELWFAALLTVTFVVLWGGLGRAFVGIVQRVFVGLILAWLFVLAANVRRADTPARAIEPNAPSP
jgi:Protein of unknown function (DUF998)